MEINYMQFKEGIHIGNHISNSFKDLTSKIATLETLGDLRLNLKNGVLKSDIIKDIQEFYPATYRLDMVADLHQFLNLDTEGLWLEKKS